MYPKHINEYQNEMIWALKLMYWYGPVRGPTNSEFKFAIKLLIPRIKPNHLRFSSSLEIDFSTLLLGSSWLTDTGHFVPDIDNHRIM